MKNILKINDLTYLFILTTFLCGFLKNTLIIFGIVLFHELGHVIFAYLLKYKIISIEIFPFGGITKISSLINDNIFKCLFVASGGVIFQLIIAFFIKDALILKYNNYILFFNLLPIIPLDGSKILFEFLNLIFNYKQSIYILFIISIISIIIYCYINYYYVINNYMIIFLLIYNSIIFFKNRNIFQSKFILERILYDLGYYKIANNVNLNKYRKGYKYFYLVNNTIKDEKEYILQVYSK